jgi:adenylate kinase
MKYIIIGPPGSGKGTLSKEIAKQYNLQHISTGELLRERSKINDETGKVISNLINNGNFVSDDLIKTIIEEEIKKNPNFILDGFPRTTKQYHMLNKIFENESKKPVAIVLQAGIKVVLERIKIRSQKENREDDKSEEILKTRMTEYIKKTQPVVNQYLRYSSSIILDANKTKEEVFEDFKQKL